MYMFSHPRAEQGMSLPPHRGFAFATFHPGTAIPSMPWGM